jgi:thioredoxin 1
VELPSFPEWTEDTLEERATRAGRPVLVVFWSEPGTPADALAPVLEAVAQEFAGRAAFAQVKVGRSPGRVPALKLGGTPTVAVFDGPALVEQRAGAAPLWVYREMLERALVAYTA